ncbi:MAG: adenylate/guanylate cyclase domain-containing protein, partial [Beijerinckiaceae bacterium]
MSLVADPIADGSSAGSPPALALLVRRLRLATGLVLMAFALSHFLNHAAGIFGIAFMKMLQEPRYSFWREMPGAALLYGSLALHVALTLWRVVGRRTLRMPRAEALQILLGLLIPLLLVDHVIGTKVAATVANFDDSYQFILKYFRDNGALKQSLALLVVWLHGVIGLNFAFQTYRWFRRWRPFLEILAILVPVLALAGFTSALNELKHLTLAVQTMTPDQASALARAAIQTKLAVYGGVGLAVLVIGGRMLGLGLKRSVTVSYTGHGERKGGVGMTLLEISRKNRVPHPSSCGGRGRCASCRVLVTGGADALPPPGAIEAALLRRVHAPANVRLACQLRPTADVSVRVLGANLRGAAEAAGDAGPQAERREIVALVADIRAFSQLARSQMPGDLVEILVRVLDDIGQAVAGHGGQIATRDTDGFVAVFGLKDDAKTAARAALACADDMQAAMTSINRNFRKLLPQPLRLGVGIHLGDAVVTVSDDPEASLNVIGDTVVVASRLEEATKELAGDMVISEAV